eukprot:scaffold32164_cov71-Phaeocystis_antarctica.AAC.6
MARVEMQLAVRMVEGRDDVRQQPTDAQPQRLARVRARVRGRARPQCLDTGRLAHSAIRRSPRGATLEDSMPAHAHTHARSHAHGLRAWGGEVVACGPPGCMVAGLQRCRVAYICRVAASSRAGSTAATCGDTCLDSARRQASASR